MDKMKILVTFANVWKMDNGQSGMTINYFMYGENGEQMISRMDATGGAVGQQRGSDGKPVLTVEDLDFFSRVQILPEQPEKK